MYKMPEFTEANEAAVIDFIKANPFITLIGNYNNRSVATQVPVLISEQDNKILLRGHIMRKTDHHIAFEHNPQALILFNGPHCYVSASWYNERHIGSTWNYMTVHARGTVKLLGFEETKQLITDLTHKYEGTRQQPELVEKMPQEYVDGMVKAIVAFEIVLEDIYPLFKLSQNRNDESYKNIVNRLLATNDHGSEEIANEMIKRRQELFVD
jgi:transcriptional regulator